MVRYRRRYRLWSGAATATTVLALGMIGAASPSMAASAATAAPAVTAAAGPASATPAAQTPHLLSTAPAEQVRQLVQCGGTMYAVGSFTKIKRNSTTYTRNNIFSFSATSPFKVTSWAPAVNGVVNSIAFSGTNCADAYIGGKFSAIGGTAVKDIAKISTSTGAVVTAFAHTAEAQIETLISYKAHIIAGGYDSSINGSSASPYMTSLNSTTGKDDGFVKLNISGNYSYPGVASNGTRVFNQALSHSGTLDMVMGDFTSVGGKGRQQIFMLNLATSPASLTPWTSPEFDGSKGNTNVAGGFPYQCATSEPFYIQAAAWSPDDKTIYIGNTGYHPYNVPVTDPHTGQHTARTGLCDAAVAFPAAASATSTPLNTAPVLHSWINYTGCDSLFAAAADSGAAYFAGHERYSMNPTTCDTIGTGALAAPGMEGLTPGTGSLLLNASGGARYTRSRGLGADDMLVTSAGLWIGSDNGNYATVNGKQVWQGSQTCGGVSGLAGICFLPYSN
jgi:hypothetical protein